MGNLILNSFHFHWIQPRAYFEAVSFHTFSCFSWCRMHWMSWNAQSVRITHIIFSASLQFNLCIALTLSVKLLQIIHSTTGSTLLFLALVIYKHTCRAWNVKKQMYFLMWHKQIKLSLGQNVYWKANKWQTNHSICESIKKSSLSLQQLPSKVVYMLRINSYFNLTAAICH